MTVVEVCVVVVAVEVTGVTEVSRSLMMLIGRQLAGKVVEMAGKFGGNAGQAGQNGGSAGRAGIEVSGA